jgi:hypothetical protein
MSAQAQVREKAASLESYVPSGWGGIGFWVCIVIAVAVVIRRLYALLSPPRNAPPQLAALDTIFASHVALTLAHILPALAFVVVAPFVVFRSPARRLWAERLLFPLGGVVGLTAYAMSAYSVGGWVERSAVLAVSRLQLHASR